MAPHLRLCAVLLLGTLSGLGVSAWADPSDVSEAPPVLLVDGEEAGSHFLAPQRIRGEWYVAAAPIAEALWTTLTFDPATLSVETRASVTGSVLQYVGTTGEGLRDHAYAVTLAPGLPVGTSTADLMLPLDLVEVLFDVTASVTPWEDEIHLVSRRLAHSLSDVPGFGLREIEYRGWAHRYLDRADGGVELDAHARLGERGRWDSHVTSQVDREQNLSVQNLWTAYDDGIGNRWSAGDLRGGGGLRWLGAFGRGARWDGERGRGRHRYHAGLLRLSSGYGGGGIPGNAQWDGGAGVFSYERGARPGAPIGSSLGLGAAVLGDRAQGGNGALLGFEHRMRTSRWRVGTTGGLFADPARTLRHRLAAELQAEWFATRRLNLNGRIGRYERDFQLLSPFFAERNSRFAQFGSRVQMKPWLSFSTSHSAHQRYDDGGRFDQFSTESISVQPRHPYVDSFGISFQQTTGTDLALGNQWSFDVRGRWAHGQWYQVVRQETGGESPWAMNLGALARTSQGTGQLSTSWQDLALEGVSADWSRSFLGARRLRASVGGHWSRVAPEGTNAFLADVRLSWDFFPGHGVDVSWDEQPTTYSTRTQWRGRFLFPEAGGQRGAGIRGSIDRHVSRIEGRVYLDRNDNGTFDDTDRPLRGAEIVLDGGLTRTLTDADGHYSFAAVRTGKHRLVISPETVRADLSLLDDIERRVLVPAFKTAVVDYRTCVNRRVAGTVFHDLDGDGHRDPEEPGVPDVHLVVSGRSDTLSDPQGRFRLSDLPPGTHEISVDPGSLRDGDTAAGPWTVLVPVDRDPERIEIPVRPLARPVKRRVFP